MGHEFELSLRVKLSCRSEVGGTVGSVEAAGVKGQGADERTVGPVGW